MHTLPLLVLSCIGSLVVCFGLSSQSNPTRNSRCTLEPITQVPSLVQNPLSVERREFLSLVILSGPVAPAVAALPPASRDVDVGGGFDLLGSARPAEKDVIYPVSMEGLWVCNRVVTQTEGDSFQADSAWRALSGGSSLKVNQVEVFQTRFVQSSVIGDDTGVVMDRGYEVSSRGNISNLLWKVDEPDNLAYDKVTISVVKRSIEPPTDQGFGFNELYRIDDGLVTRAAQVKRRYWRAFDSNGNRVVEGLEIMKTFRVLDGVAGTEIPTSTTKSQIRLTRQ